MKALAELVDGRVDYLIFTALTLVSFSVFDRCVLRRSHVGRTAQIAWGLIISALIGGWFLTDQWGLEQRGHMEGMVMGYGPTYARELERMGHAYITKETPAEDPRYLDMIEAEKRWLKVNPSVNDIYTLRPTANRGAMALIVDSETDYDRNGIYEGDREARTEIGEPYGGEVIATAWEAMRGHAAFMERAYTDRWGTWVTAFVPMEGPDGKVEAVLGVDFDAATWVAAISQQRLSAIGYLAVLILVVATASGVAAQLISARQLAAQLSEQGAIRLSEQRLSRMFDACPFPTAILTADGYRCVQVNTAFLAALGRTAEEAIGVPLWQLGVVLSDAVRGEVDAAVAAARPAERLDCTLRRALGEPRKALLWLEPFSLAAGPHMLAIAQDISEQAMLESRLREAQRLEAVGQLAAGVAHEINTPIQFVGDNLRFLRGGLLEVLQSAEQGGRLLRLTEVGPVAPAALEEIRAGLQGADLDYLTEEMPRAIEQSLDGLSRVAEIVRAMKQFSHPGNLEKQSADLHELIDSAVTVSRNEWKFVADVETDFAATLPRVVCDPGEISQVLLNLIVNAAHAIADVPAVSAGGRGRIRITTRDEATEVVVRVADSGTGIPEHVRPKIFDPFFTTKEIGKGTGQGLFLAHRTIVEHHHGTIAVDSQPGQGTTFEIRLPVG